MDHCGWCRLPEMPEEEMAPGRWHGASIRAPRRSKSREELKQVHQSTKTPATYITTPPTSSCLPWINWINLATIAKGPPCRGATMYHIPFSSAMRCSVTRLQGSPQACCV